MRVGPRYAGSYIHRSKCSKSYIGYKLTYLDLLGKSRYGDDYLRYEGIRRNYIDICIFCLKSNLSRLLAVLKSSHNRGYIDLLACI